MGKDRCGKLEVMLGVNDSELKTPEHDEMCLWVDKNWKKIISEKINLIPIDELWKQTRCCKVQYTKCEFFTILGYYERCTKNDKDCKYPENDDTCPMIKKARETMDESKKLLNILTIDDLYDMKFLWEVPIKNNGFVIGIPDFTILLTQKEVLINDYFFIPKFLPMRRIIIEVKPKIKSIGETMRQIKLYQSYMYQREGNTFYDNDAILITQSNNLDVFEQQGIKTYTYK